MTKCLTISLSLALFFANTSIADIAACTANKKPFEWVNLQVPTGLGKKLHGKDVNALVDFFRMEYMLKILLFAEYPKKTKTNPRLKFKMSAEETAAKARLLDEEQTVWQIAGTNAKAQYLPPWYSNRDERGPRVLLSEPLLTLGRDNEEDSALHEFLHHLYQKQVYGCWYSNPSAPTAHPYQVNGEKLASLQDKVRTAAGTLSGEANLRRFFAAWLELKTHELEVLAQSTEEVAVWKATYLLGREMGLENEQVRTALWKRWSKLSEIADQIEKIHSSAAFRDIGENPWILSTEEKNRYAKLKDGLENYSTELAEKNGEALRDAVELKDDGISAAIAKAILSRNTP